MVSLQFIQIIHQSDVSKLELMQDLQTGNYLVRRTLKGGKRLETLYQSLKSIISPTLPMLYEIEVQGDDLVLLEEYIDGIPLSKMLEGGKVFSDEELEHIALSLCDALILLHGQNIIHRDLKPSNIMQTGEGDSKLIDFDAARFFARNYDNDTRTLGTVGYAAPEQYGYSQSDFRTDVYGFGATLYQLRTGCLPQSGQKYEGKYAAVVGKCLAFDPENRYASIREVREALLAKPKQKSMAKRWYMHPAVIAAIVMVALVLTVVRIGVLRDGLNLPSSNTQGERMTTAAKEFYESAEYFLAVSNTESAYTNILWAFERSPTNAEIVALKDEITLLEQDRLCDLAEEQFVVSDYQSALSTIVLAEEMDEKNTRVSALKVKIEPKAAEAAAIAQQERQAKVQKLLDENVFDGELAVAIVRTDGEYSYSGKMTDTNGDFYIVCDSSWKEACHKVWADGTSEQVYSISDEAKAAYTKATGTVTPKDNLPAQPPTSPVPAPTPVVPAPTAIPVPTAERVYSDDDVVSKAFERLKDKAGADSTATERIYHHAEVTSSYVTFDDAANTYTCVLEASYSTNVFDLYGGSATDYSVTATYFDSGEGLMETDFNMS